MEQSQLNSRLDLDRENFLAHGRHSLGLPALFYGSLRAAAVFEIVVGRPIETASLEPVVLHDHELARIIAGDGFPGIFPSEDGGELSCLMMTDLSAEEELRVAWYEWDEYKLGRFTVSDGREAQAFVPDIEAVHRLHGSIDFQPWTFEDWAERNLTAAIPNARTWMNEMPDVTPLLAGR